MSLTSNNPTYTIGIPHELFHDGASVYPTVEEAVNASMSPSGSSIFVLGNEASGDGGGGYYNRSSVEPPHTAKFQTQDGDWYELSPNQDIKVEMFGAKADNYSNNTTPFSNAINYCRTKNIGKLYFAEGVYLIHSRVQNYTGRLMFIGQSMGRTVIRGTTSDAYVDFVDTQQAGLRDIYLDAAGIANYGFRIRSTTGRTTANGFVAFNAWARNGVIANWDMGYGADGWTLIECNGSCDTDNGTLGQEASLRTSVVGKTIGGTFGGPNWGISITGSVNSEDVGKFSAVGTRFNFCGAGWVRWSSAGNNSRNGAAVFSDCYFENAGLRGPGTYSNPNAICFLIDRPGRLIINTPRKLTMNYAQQFINASNGSVVEYIPGAAMAGGQTTNARDVNMFYTDETSKILVHGLPIDKEDINRQENNPYFTSLRGKWGVAKTEPPIKGWAIQPVNGKLIKSWDGSNVSDFTTSSGILSVDMNTFLTGNSSIKFVGDGTSTYINEFTTEFTLPEYKNEFILVRAVMRGEIGTTDKLAMGILVRDGNGQSVDFGGRSGGGMKSASTPDQWFYMDSMAFVHNPLNSINVAFRVSWVGGQVSDDIGYIDRIEVWSFNGNY